MTVVFIGKSLRDVSSGRWFERYLATGPCTISYEEKMALSGSFKILFRRAHKGFSPHQFTGV